MNLSFNLFAVNYSILQDNFKGLGQNFHYLLLHFWLDNLHFYKVTLYSLFYWRSDLNKTWYIC